MCVTGVGGIEKGAPITRGLWVWPEAMGVVVQ